MASHPFASFAAILLASVMILNIVLPTQKQWIDVGWTAITTDGSTYVIATGSQEDELVFVAIAGRSIDSMDDDGVESIVSGGATVGENWHWLLRPDGTKTKLPADRQLFELIDGQWRESDRRVTLNEWNGFLDSDPQRISIGAFLSWLDQTGT